MNDEIFLETFAHLTPPINKFNKNADGGTIGRLFLCFFNLTYKILC